MKNQKFVSGAVLRIPLSGNLHIYGRLLKRPYVEIFDCLTKNEINDLQFIVSRPRLFACCIYTRSALSSGNWRKIGKLPFDETAMISPLHFIQEMGDFTKCYTMDWFGNKQIATIDECRRLERLAVWPAEDVVRRIEDHYAGRQNSTLQSLKFREHDEVY